MTTNTPPMQRVQSTFGSWLKRAALLALPLSLPAIAHAAFLEGEALDTAADIMAWVVLIFAPLAGIGIFLLVHILPEKIAEKKQHPQAKAIQTLCVLSLFFGGLLWPLAWLWAYSKPVFYKMAYGTDAVAHGHEPGLAPASPAPASPDDDAAGEIQLLRDRLGALEAKLKSKSAAEAVGA